MAYECKKSRCINVFYSVRSEICCMRRITQKWSNNSNNCFLISFQMESPFCIAEKTRMYRASFRCHPKSITGKTHVIWSRIMRHYHYYGLVYANLATSKLFICLAIVKEETVRKWHAATMHHSVPIGHCSIMVTAQWPQGWSMYVRTYLVDEDNSFPPFLCQELMSIVPHKIQLVLLYLALRTR